MDSRSRDRLTANLQQVRDQMAAACHQAGRACQSVTLVAVTKYAPLQAVQYLYELGIRDFGENRPQALWERASLLPADCRWHLIGQLQTNKVRRTLPLLSLLHAMDRDKLAHVLDAEARLANRTVAALFEVNITGEASKSGFAAEELLQQAPALFSLPHIQWQGLMTMAPLDADAAICRGTFARLRQLREELLPLAPGSLPLLSMGMTQDFPLAIAEGATHIRVGSALFEGLDECCD